MTMNKSTLAIHLVSHERPLFEQDIDAYQAKGKLPEPTACPQCGAVFHEGRWQWSTIPDNAHSEICPACHRINDHYPAGFITLEGEFLKAHSEEVMHLINNLEQHERAEHPLKRIMAIEHLDDSVLVTTTDIHLARGIGEAVRHAYQGQLELHYNTGEYLLRVHWNR